MAGGADSPGWKGDEASIAAKYCRTKKTYALGGPCERCGERGEHRHHRDRDVGNNEPENIEILCIGCHNREHFFQPPKPCQNCGRLHKPLNRGRCGTCYQYWFTHGRDRSPDRERILALRAAGFCQYGHPLAYVGGQRRCRTCKNDSEKRRKREMSTS